MPVTDAGDRHLDSFVMAQAMFPESTALHLDFRLREASTHLILTDDLQIHLLQLNKLRATAENVYHAIPAERWAYFLQNADKLTSGEIRRLFPDKEISEAAGVLEMISKSPEQLMLYNARLKVQRDEVARILQARQEGRQEGRITLLLELLGLRPFTAEEFSRCDAAQLNSMAEQLQQQLRARNS